MRDAAVGFFDRPPAQTYDALTKRCRDDVTRDEWVGQMALASSFIESLYGFTLDEMSVSDVAVVDFDSDAGTAETRLVLVGPGDVVVGDDDETSAWLFEDGGWKIDDCDIDSTNEPNTSGGTDNGVSTETALSWPERFCRLEEGMTRAEVRSIMGEPTAEFLDDFSQDGYHAYQFQITVFYSAPRAQDPDPMSVRVTSLSADSTGQFTEMTDEDIALFPCAAEVFDEATLAAARANGAP